MNRQAAVQARQFPLALSLIELPITSFDKSVRVVAQQSTSSFMKRAETSRPLSLKLSDLDHTDVLQYYYLGGVTYAVLRLWEKAEEFLETVGSHSLLDVWLLWDG